MTGWIATILLMVMVGVGLMVFLMPYIIIGAMFALPVVGAYYFMKRKEDGIEEGCEHLDEL